MNKELIDLYKSKPELIDEHRRLVQILRHGSDAEQKKEAERQLKELKEMLSKEEKDSEDKKYLSTDGKTLINNSHIKGVLDRGIKNGVQTRTFEMHDGSVKETYYPHYDELKASPQHYGFKNLVKEELEKRCWEGYKPVPGKKPYEKGSCEPVSKEEDEVLKVEKNGQWSLGKSNSIKPFGQNIYDANANIKRKENRTGEVVEGAGSNQAVHKYTGIRGTAREQADREQREDDAKNKKQEVTSVDFSKLSLEQKEEARRQLESGKKVHEINIPGLDIQTDSPKKIRAAVKRKQKGNPMKIRAAAKENKTKDNT